MGSASDIILEVDDLCVTVGKGKEAVSLVSHISFALKKHKTLAIIGESGSGKTTLALSLMRLLPSHFSVHGKVHLEGINLYQVSEQEMRHLRGGKIALVFQDPDSALNPVFTIGDQVLEALILHHSYSEDLAFEKTLALLDLVGLPRVDRAFETYPHQLSGGMKQRVMIAIAISANPRVLILDEPTTALDLTVQKEILQLIADVQRQLGVAQLLISHDMGVVAEMADDVAVMYASEIVEYGPVESLFSAPLHPYTKALFAARPSLINRKKRLPIADGTVSLAGHEGCPYHGRCPFAMPKCKRGIVKTFRRGSHWARCWLLEEDHDPS